MASAIPTELDPGADPGVRTAGDGDATRIVRAVRALLAELGGEVPAQEDMLNSARRLIGDPAAGAALVAESREELVGVIVASWQLAVHVPGEYALIQDLWVDPPWRSRGVGRELLAGLLVLARSRGIQRVEVGLPSEGFARLPASERFYSSSLFVRTGPRMRRLLL